MPTILKDKIIFNEQDWLATLNPQYSVSPTSNQKIGNGLASARAFDPYRNLGYASPGFGPTDATNVSVVDAILRHSATDGVNGKAYFIGGTKLHQLTIISNTITTPTTFPHAISGATLGQECVFYDINVAGTRTQKLLYSWKDGSNGNIGVYDKSTTFDDDWMSTIPANAATFDTNEDHSLIVGADDILYVGDGNNVHAIDGATGADATLSKNVLILPKEYVITGFARLEPRLLCIFAHSNLSGDSFNRSKATAFFWNYLDEDPERVIDLDDNFVRGAFEFDGTIGCFTSGRRADKNTNNRSSRLKLWNGSKFKEIVSYIGDVPLNGGVDILGDMIMWNSDGVLFSYDSPFKGQPIGLNRLAEGTGASENLEGVLVSLSKALQVMSTGATTAGGLQKIDTNYFEQASMATVLAKPVWPTGKQGIIKRIITKYGNIASGGLTITLQLKNRAGTVLSDFITNNATVTASTLVVKTEKVDAKFDDLKLIMSWGSGAGVAAAPIIDSVEVEFETINI